MGPALLITAALIVGTTGAFFVAHSAVAGAFRIFMALDPGDVVAPGVPGFPDGGYEEDAPYDPNEYEGEPEEYSGDDDYDYDYE